MSPSISETMIATLRKVAALDDDGKFHVPAQTCRALERRGLVEIDDECLAASATPLGMVAAHTRGWVPTDRQQELLIALADGTINASNRYRPHSAPTAVLESLCDMGLAKIVRRYQRYTGTRLCHELALILRQQELPPPCGLGGGGDERAHA